MFRVSSFRVSIFPDPIFVVHSFLLGLIAVEIQHSNAKLLIPTPKISVI